MYFLFFGESLKQIDKQMQRVHMFLGVNLYMSQHKYIHSLLKLEKIMVKRYQLNIK